MFNKNEYDREYNKENYKVVKVYVRKEEYETIEKHIKRENPKAKVSGYIKTLIEKDIREVLGGGLRGMSNFLINLGIKLITFLSNLFIGLMGIISNIIKWIANLF